MTSQFEEKKVQQMYFIHGAEDLLILESQDEIRKSSYAQGFTERSRFYFNAKSNWDEVFAEKNQDDAAKNNLNDFHQISLQQFNFI